MTAQHTPGPWLIQSQKPYAIRGHIMTEEGNAIADTAIEYSSIESEEEHEANARLIASSPSLLEKAERLVLACKKYCEAHDMHGDDHPITGHAWDRMKGASRSMRQTIRIAKGE